MTISRNEVSAIIAHEIGDDWSHTNAHGVDLLKCLVTPERKRYIGPIKDDETFDLWLVLEEDPETRNGYKIVFDETKKMFGLALVDDRDRHVFIGYYGTFMETLDAM